MLLRSRHQTKIVLVLKIVFTDGHPLPFGITTVEIRPRLGASMRAAGWTNSVEWMSRDELTICVVRRSNIVNKERPTMHLKLLITHPTMAHLPISLLYIKGRQEFQAQFRT